MNKTVLLIFSLSLVGCCIFKPRTPVEKWELKPDDSSDKIKIVTNISTNDLKAIFTRRMQSGYFKLDTSTYRLRTLPKKIERYLTRITVEVNDSSAIISGENEVPHPGMPNSYYWTPVQKGSSRLGTTEWETMKAAFARPERNAIWTIFYNRKR